MTSKTKMTIFLGLIAAHWVEHFFQMYQVYVQHLHRECALGFLGMKYPWLVRTEILHFAFALFTTAGMYWIGDQYFTSWKATKFWAVGYLISIWHLFEHSLLFGQALAGRAHPTSIIQLFVPRIELHLFYNSIITYFIMYALIREWWFQREVRTITREINAMMDDMDDHAH